MGTLLVKSLKEYWLNDKPLLIILCIIAVAIVAIVIALIVLGVKRSKAKKARAAEVTEEPVLNEQAPEAEPAKEEAKAEEPKAEEPAPAVEEKPAEEVTAVETAEVAETKENTVEKTPKKTEPAKKAAPVKKAEPAKKVEPAKKAEPVKKAEPAKISAVNGKWVIENVKGKYWFTLYAPNGQVMLESSTPYSSLSGARSGIKTYQENIAAGRLEIVEHKNGDSQVQILNGRGGLLATSSTYSSRSQAENSSASIKRWAQTDAVEVLDEENK